MEITSLGFGAFVIGCLVLYYLLPVRGQNYFLLLASYVFFTACAWQLSLILAGLTLFNFLLAPHVRKRAGKVPLYLWAGLLGNIGVVWLFKYFDFFVPRLSHLLQHWTGLAIPELFAIAFPVGLSYRLLENIAYLLDVYRDQLKAERNLVHFALYCAFFPKLIAGPIERPKHLLERIAGPRTVTEADLSAGFTLIMLGLVRKLVIADTLAAAIPHRLFGQPGLFPASQLVICLVVYVFVIYNDFAGYTDIVRGVARLFGFELTINFNSPFFSRTFSEIWLRWHVSLSYWLRDYVFMPLSRALLRRIHNPRNLVNLALPLLVTMWVSALWHQVSLAMLVWGSLIGLYMVSGRVYGLWKRSDPPDQRPLWRQLWGMLLVLTLAGLATIPFRMDLGQSLAFVKALANWKSFASPGISAFVMIGLSLAIDFCQYRGRDEVVFLKWPRFWRVVLLAAAFLAVFVATRFRPAAPFIYQGF